MSIDEFFERLPKSGWGYDEYGDIRHKSTDADGYPCCPLLAALPATRRKEHHVGNPLAAANELHIHISTARKIIRAADGTGEQKLRARLLAHCGLKEDAE